ncbi:MAG: MBG domain-containing protein, partial [Cytophagales bacterium]|nr:MBG domain-containing protein [Cytophagales bacterium]
MSSRFVVANPITNLTAQPDATSIILNWDSYAGDETLKEYKVKRNGIYIGSTIGKYGYFTDHGLSPGTTYSYLVEGFGPINNIICQSEIIEVQTTSQTTVKTNYKLLAIVFNPGSVLDPELNHIQTFLRYRLDFLKNSSHNSVILDVYNDDIVTLDAFPPLQLNSTYVDYAKLAVTPYPELNGDNFVDLIEKYEIDIVWVVGTPVGHDFGENILMGNKNLGNNTWISTKVKCSRSFFIHSNSPDARAFDAAAHHVEGTMTSATDKDPFAWPRDKEYLVYTKVREDYSVYPAKLHLFEQFRLTDEWNGIGAFASKGNASCGSSHFVPGSIRNSVNYSDYTYYDIEAWQRYVDCYADKWLNYPDFSGESRKINGFDFGAFNNYTENHTSYSFRFGTSSFHFWWFNHIPHNPGVTNGKLNNWWPYIYDCNRFDGTAIDFPVYGFPITPTEYIITNNEYGTETSDAEAWGFWHSCTDFGQRADTYIVDNTNSPEYIKNGQYAIKVDVDVESFSFNGRNDMIYPRFRNAHWDFLNMHSLSLSIKFVDQALIRGTNPIVRLCKNGNNRIEFVPRKTGIYTNLFNDEIFKDSNGWFNFRIPMCGDETWERNVIGYMAPGLTPIQQEQAKLQLIKHILEDVNYIEISIQAGGSRGESIKYYIDDLKFLPKDTAKITFDNLITSYDGSPKRVTATTDPEGLPVRITYDGSDEPPVNAGSYEVTGTVEDASYQGTTSSQLIIHKAPATVRLGDLEATYDGSPKRVTATTDPEGLPVRITYDGSDDPPVSAGSYEVTGTVEDANYQGTARGQLVIHKAPATVRLGDLEATYDGISKPVTATTVPEGLSVHITYDGSDEPPVNAGSYEVAGTVEDANYDGTARGQLVIHKAPATVRLGDLEAIYDGDPKSV